MKTKNKISAGRLTPFPNNLNSGTPIQDTIRKVVKRWKIQFIVSGVLVVLATLTFLEHRLDLPRLFTGTPPSPVNWTQIAFDLVTIFLVGFASVLMLSALQSKRKSAEGALNNASNQWQTTFDSVKDLIMVLDPDCKITKVNLATTKFLRRPIEEVIGKTCHQLFHGTDMPPLDCPLEKMKKTKKHEETEYYLSEKDVWILVSVDPILDDKGNLTGAVHVVRDITRRKQAEEALKKERQKLFSVLDIMPMFVYLQAPDHSVRFTNRKFRELFGDPGNRPCYEAFYGRKEPCDPCITLRVLKTKAPQTWEWASNEGRTYMIYEDLFPGEGGEDLVLEIGADITERKRAEEALKESEEKFRTLAESAQCGITIFQEEKSIYNNPAVTSYTGYTEEELACMNFWDMVRPDFKELVKERGKSRQEGKPVPASYEIPIIIKNGEERWIDISVGTCELSGKPAVISTAFDITERKRAEEKIKAEKEFSEKLISTANAIIVGLDREHRIQLFSEGAERITGYQAEEVMGKDWFEIFFKKEMYPEMIKVWSDAWGKDLYSYTNPIYSKAGKEIIAQWSNTTIVDDKKEPILLLCIAVDITERKRAEEEIRKLSQYLETIIDNANVWLDVLDEKAQVVIWNKAAEQISGFSREEVVGHGKIWEWLYPDERYRKEITTKAAAIIEKGEMVEDFETTIRCKNGEIKIISWHSRDLLGADGKPIGSIALGRDVTEKKKMEAQLIQSERLAAVGTLSYGIAHEFNNILAGILGNAEFGMGNDDPQEMKECFQIIMESCDMAKSITNSLLAFSRQRETKKQRADVTEAVETVLGLVERDMEKQNIKTVRKFNPIPEVVCDLGELSGVVLNMITNARDAMRPKGGTLTIEIEKKGDNIEIIFTDTGCGIPDHIKGRIFEPFVTTKGALGQSEIPGTGLGLFLSYGIIKRYDGEIGVKSEVGKGSTFTIKIPISKNQVAPALVKGKEEKPMDVPKNLHILLVDDEKPICTALKKFFEAKGHSITTALSGKKGLKVFKKGEFDLVLADIIMPDMDGVELISKLKKIDKQVKFIVLTGHIGDEKLEKAKKAGADQVLMKPFRNEELYQAIGKVLSS